MDTIKVTNLTDDPVSVQGLGWLLEPRESECQEYNEDILSQLIDGGEPLQEQLNQQLISIHIDTEGDGEVEIDRVAVVIENDSDPCYLLTEDLCFLFTEDLELIEGDPNVQ